MNKIKLSLIILALAQIACMQSASRGPAESATPAPTSTPLPLPLMVKIEEPASGAVYEVPEPKRLCAIVNANALHLRTEASENGRIITWLDYGQRVVVLTHAGNWWTVKAGELTGYVKAEYLTETECK